MGIDEYGYVICTTIPRLHLNLQQLSFWEAYIIITLFYQPESIATPNPEITF